MRKLIPVLLLPFYLLAQDHLLISEAMIPSSTEQGKTFIEIYNPTSQAVDLSDVYLANYNTYYNSVNGQYSNNSAHFLVRFPAQNLAAGANVVVALDGAAFTSAFGSAPDFEILGTDGAVTDMSGLYIGGAAKLESSAMIVLFQWDGQSDLVQDIDYIPWGLSFFSSRWTDKSGISIDGPDGDSDASSYNAETAVGSQDAPATPTGGQSLQRNGVTESNENSSGGNGIAGHDETSEAWSQSLRTAGPSPGSFSEVAGDGSGTVSVNPDTVDAATQVLLEFSAAGEDPYTLTDLQLVVPANWAWPQNSSAVTLSGTGFASAGVTVNDDTINVESAQLTSGQQGVLQISNLTTPSVTVLSTFRVSSATSGGTLTPVSEQPQVQVIAPLSIADIQNDFDTYNGEVVTLEAVVAIGANVTRTDHTDAYIQDASGRGINAFESGTAMDREADLARGNRIRITGTIGEFPPDDDFATTQISNFTIDEIIATGEDVPSVANVTIAEARDISLEGTMVETAGIINDIFEVGGGTNVTIEDGTGSIVVRAWNTTGVDLSGYSVGDTVGVRAVVDIFNEAAQLLLAYQEDIFAGSIDTPVDGSGVVSVTPENVNKSESVDLTFAFAANALDEVTQVTLDVPPYWNWSQSSADVNTGGAFADATVSVNGNRVELQGASLAEDFPGSVVLNNLTAPDADTVSTFTVRTAGSGGTLREIAISPLVTVGNGTAIDFTPISEARNRPVNSTVTIKGVVVIGAGILRNDFTSAYLADESGAGINVFRPGGLDPAIERGNEVLMTGVLEEFNGILEITDYEVTVLRRDAPLPDPIELTTAQASETTYEGSWVRVTGIIQDLFSAGGGTNIVVRDGGQQAVTVRVWNTTGVDVSAYEVGDLVEVTGSHGIFSNAGQILLGYDEDISLLDLSEAPVILDVPPKPFAPEIDDTFPITYSAGPGDTRITLRIYDLGGRLVATLLDDAGVPLESVFPWDGRNQFGELVQLGTYIIHLEVVNENSGKKTTKVAPVVVGTLLSR